MAAQSSLEGLAKLMAAKSMIGGAAGKVKDFASGDKRLEKKMKKRAAKEKAVQQRKILADEREEHSNWLRDNGSMLQAIKDRAFGWRKHLTEEQQAYKDNKDFDKQVKKDKKLEGKQRRAGFVSGMSTEEWAEQAAYTEAEDRANLSARDIEDREKDIEQRRAALADRMTRDKDGELLDNEYVKMGRERLLALIENKEFDEERAKIQKEFNAKQEAALGFLDEAPVTSPTITPGENVGPGAGADIGGGIDGSVAAIEELTITTLDTNKILIEGLGVHSPPFLETILKNDDGAPTIEGENIGVDSAPDVSASPDVSMETMLDGEPMPVQSDQFAELLEIEREELDFDRRREAREIKEARMALEDRRDSKINNAKRLMGGKGKKPDKKKKKGGGFLSSLMRFGGKYLVGIVSGWLGLKTALGLSTKADDVARAANATKNATKTAEKTTKAVKNISTKADDAARLLNQTDEIAKVSTKVDDVVKPLSKVDDVVDATGKVTSKVDEAAKAGSKSAKLLTVGDDVVKTTTSVTKLADGVPSTNLGTVTGKVDEVAQGVTKSVDDVGKGVKTVGTKMDKVGKMVKDIPKMTTNLVKGLKLGAKAATAATLVTKVAGGADAIPSGAPTLAKAPPGGDKTSKVIQKGAKVGTEILDKGMKPVTQSVKTILKVTKGAGKLATTFGKYLAPLDLLNKMGQGQGMWESIGNMGLEIVNLAAGAGEGIVEGVQHLAGGALGEGGFSDKSAADIAFQDADLLGNKEKWQTSYLEQGINKGVEMFTGQEIANKKVYTEEQEELAFAAENDAGAVDIGFGQGEIEDLQALSLLDEKTLEALLAYEVFSDDDQKQIEDLLEAKKMGLTATYDDGGWLGGEKITYGDQGQTAEQKAYAASLDPSKRPDMEEYKPEEEGMFGGMWNKFASLFEHTPDVASADKMAQTTTIMAEQATTPGSIFTHDTHLEQTLWNIWAEEKSFFDPKTMGTEATVAEDTAPTSQLIPLDNQELMAPVPVIDVSPNAPAMGMEGGMIPSELLAQVISQISAMEKQAAVGTSGGNNSINTNSSVDNSVTNFIPPPSTAHAGIIKAGSGRG